MPNISVITPVKARNEQQRRWLYYAIRSVLDQTYDDWEMVIVDDDSPADVGRVAEMFSDQRLRWFESGGGGCSASRNLAAEKAEGKFLLPLDADDKLAKSAMVDFLKGVEEGGEEAGFVYSDVMVFGQDFFRLVPAPYYDFAKLLKTTYIGVGALHLKSDWERAGGWRSDMESGLEDWEYWIALGELGVCGWRVAKPLYWYRRHPEGRLAKLRRDHDHWTRAYAKMRDLHRDTYNGRRPMGCCGKSSRAKRASKPQPVQRLEIEDGKAVMMEYTGRREGAFHIRGRVSGIRYKVYGKGSKFEAHPRDVRDLARLPSVQRAEAKEEEPQVVRAPRKAVDLDGFDPEMMDEATDIDDLEAEFEAWEEAREPSEEEIEEIEAGVEEYGEEEALSEVEGLEVPDPADLTVTYLRSGDFDATPEVAKEMIALERKGKNRITAIEAMMRKL